MPDRTQSAQETPVKAGDAPRVGRDLPRDPGGGHDATSIDPRGGVSLLDAMTILAARAYAITGIAVAFALLAVGLSVLLTPRGYVAQSSFFSQGATASQGGRLTGLAQQFGVSLGPTPGTESLAFYAELLTSPTLLRQTVESSYSVGGDSGARMTYVEHLGLESSNPESRTRAAVRHLRENLSVRENELAGLLELEVLAATPELAVQVSERMLDLVNEFNVARRQSQMRSEREFVEQRLEEYRKSLEQAEQDLEEFIDNNRSYQNAPHLALEAARLQRRVDLEQQMFTSLSQSYEEARIGEVRNTPVITIVEPPGDWVGPRGPSIARSAFLGLVFGLLVGVTWAFVSQYWRREVEDHPAAYRRLREVIRSRNPLRSGGR